MLIWGILGGLGLNLGRAATSGEVTTFRQLDALSPEQATAGAAVKIRGVILCVDEEWNQLFIHDGTQIRYFPPPAIQYAAAGWVRS